MKKSILALLGALICTLGIGYGAHAKTIDLMAHLQLTAVASLPITAFSTIAAPSQ